MAPKQIKAMDGTTNAFSRQFSSLNLCFNNGHPAFLLLQIPLPRLELVIDRLITVENVRYFYVGGYGGFDRIAAAAAKRAKQKYPDITLMLVLPYHPAERAVPTPNGFDGSYHPEGLENTPRQYAIVRTNQIMVDSCDWLLCYVRHGASNSRNLLEYAQRREEKGLIQMIIIGESEEEK